MRLADLLASVWPSLGHTDSRALYRALGPASDPESAQVERAYAWINAWLAC